MLGFSDTSSYALGNISFDIPGPRAFRKYMVYTVENLGTRGIGETDVRADEGR